MKNNNKKTLNSFSALVYSTNPDSIPQEEEENVITLDPQQQKLRVRIDKKQRKGKTVTIVSGFIGNDDDLEELAKKLKTKCGTGGNAKDGEIIIQGDMLTKIIDTLKEWGYKQTK